MFTICMCGVTVVSVRLSPWSEHALNRESIRIKDSEDKEQVSPPLTINDHEIFKEM